MTQILRHATCIDLGGKGILLLGPPGSGKSSLALQLIDSPGHGLGEELLRARLVADDQVVISARSGCLLATAPEALRGLIEVRGIGILKLLPLQSTKLALAVELAKPAATERLPEPRSIELLGLALPVIGLDAGLAAAPARLRAAIKGS
jgi:serine kinase of HPr protein (carbohydrate metabolism regulator)